MYPGACHSLRGGRIRFGGVDTHWESQISLLTDDGPSVRERSNLRTPARIKPGAASCWQGHDLVLPSHTWPFRAGAQQQKGCNE